jgi:hypothetical protein
MATDIEMTFDYRPLVEARGRLVQIGETLHMEAFENEMSAVVAFNHGVAREACEAAEDAIFRALNVLAHHAGDPEAKRVIHDRTWVTADEDQRCA